jgi:hypothetical protein
MVRAMVRPLLPVLFAVTCVSLFGCGVGGARDAAAVHSCDFSNRCGDIGSGKGYANYDECMTKQRSAWLNAWPTSSCEGHINGSALDLCLKAIDNTQCNNFLDQLATYSKCSGNDVCR